MPFGNPNVWDEDFNCFVHAAAVADASGGATNDTQARSALASANAVLKSARITGRDATDTVEPQSAGPTVYDAARRCYVFSAAIANPSGGATIDTQLRTAVGEILTAMRGAGLIAGGADIAADTWDATNNCWTFTTYTTPSGGATDDAEGRTQANAMAAALKSAGLIAT